MIQLLNIDCMEYMAGLPDKAFELAIVDPPYGINRGTDYGGINQGWKQYEKKDWDQNSPPPEYFKELFRVSKDQIIWGANYYPQYLPPSMGWIFWDKGQEISMSDGELAFTSFQRAMRKKVVFRVHIGESGGWFHPTQKPVRLYKWLLKNYATPGDRILDTHLGSASSAIAAHQMGFDFVGCELDPEYHKVACKRFGEQTLQQTLFSYD